MSDAVRVLDTPLTRKAAADAQNAATKASIDVGYLACSVSVTVRCEAPPLRVETATRGTVAVDLVHMTFTVAAGVLVPPETIEAEGYAYRLDGTIGRQPRRVTGRYESLPGPVQSTAADHALRLLAEHFQAIGDALNAR